MFSFGRETPALQSYGKLPIAKDYLRTGCGEDGGRELREWLDQAFGGAHDGSEQIVLAEPLRFLGQAKSELLQGCLWPSSDTGERRLFPYSLLVARRKKPLAADIEAGLTRAEGVWRELERTFSECQSAADGQGLLGALRGRELDVSGSPEIDAAPVELDTWLAALWPTAGREGLLELFARLLALAEERHDGPYRLPLVRDLPVRDQVLGWLAVLASAGALPEGEIPTLFFPARSLVGGGRGPGPLVVSRRPLTAEQARWLLPLDLAGELGAADLCRDLGGGDAEDSGSAEDDEGVAGGARLREALLEALASFRARGAQA